MSYLALMKLSKRGEGEGAPLLSNNLRLIKDQAKQEEKTASILGNLEI